jgi:hypothetical protein
MKKYIIITSIYNPTLAIEKFSKLSDHQLIVVGDKKTPKDWQYPNVIYLSVEDQLSLDLSLPSLLPYNHYSRKMVGYLYALKNGADIIIDTDDDNIPKNGWSFPGTEDSFNYIPNQNGFVNIYKNFTDHDQNIWPRGLPLEDIAKEKISIINEKKKLKVGVWQGLADGDPDVDAIYRLTTNNKPCNFNNSDPIVLEEGSICPFNSQNTLFIKELFPLLYLPTFVTFRFTDILRGLIAQPIMWQYGYSLGFTKATVVQERNVHNYFDDFISEIPMYINIKKVIELANFAVSPKLSISENLQEVYKALYYADIVEKKELLTLESWLKDIAKTI